CGSMAAVSDPREQAVPAKRQPPPSPAAGDPVLAAAYFLRGRAYRARNKGARAIADLTEALGRDAGHAAAYLERSKARCRLDLDVEGLADLEEALRLDPTLPQEDMEA